MKNKIKPYLKLEFKSKKAKNDFIGQLLDGWGESLSDYFNTTVVNENKIKVTVFNALTRKEVL